MKRSTVFLSAGLILVMLLTSFASRPVSSEPDLEKIRVMIEYKSGKKDAVDQTVLGLGAEVHYYFDDLNVIALTLPVTALEGISRNPNIVLIEEDPKRYLVDEPVPLEGVIDKTVSVQPVVTADRAAQTIPYGIDMVQARDVWDQDRDGVVDPGASTGSGKMICIIDSGLYTGHEDLVGVNVVGGWPTHGRYQWNSDGLGHGTHVAGTIAAMNNAMGVVGVTPGTVSLYIVRVFDDAGGWVNASSLIAAADKCRDAGANIISMSLSGPTPSSTENTAFEGYFNTNGILSVAAASNDGVSDYAYPASYNSVISVGALDETMTWADFSNFNDQVELSAPGVGVLSTVPYIETNTVTVNSIVYSANHIEFSGRGTASGELVDGGLCGSVGSWSGKVVLCQRGDYSFYQKVINVQNGGGVAALIYNNVPGNFYGTLDPNSSTIIGLSLSMEDGQALIAGMLGLSTTVVSTVTSPASGYEAWDGTSMATPHVSAVAALVWSCSPSTTNVTVRNTLTSTAMDLGEAGRDVYYGYGLVQAKAACDTLLPTSVDLISFTATGTKKNITLSWETANEIDNLGFNIYRSTSPEGTRTKINPYLIPGVNHGMFEGAIYTYVDSDVKLRTIYYYWLEDVDVSGMTTLYGPVSAMRLIR